MVRMSDPARTAEGTVPLRWLKYLPTPLFLLDRKGKLSYCNDAFVEMTGYRRDEVLGARLDALIGQRSLQELLKDVLNVYEGRGLVRVKYDLLRKSGTAVHVEMNLTPVYGDAEEGEYVTNAIGIVLDHRDPT